MCNRGRGDSYVTQHKGGITFACFSELVTPVSPLFFFVFLSALSFFLFSFSFHRAVSAFEYRVFFFLMNNSFANFLPFFFFFFNDFFFFAALIGYSVGFT